MALVNSGYGVQNTFFTISKSTVLRQNVYKEYRFLIIKPTRCTNFSNLFLEWNSTCFRRFLCPSSGVFRCTHSNGICHTGLLTACEQDQDKTVTRCFSLYTQQWYTSYKFADTLRAGSGWNCHQMFFAVHTAMVYVIQVCWQLARRIRMEPVPSWSCSQTCMSYTIAVCTVKNSWWWTEELSETCRVSFQK